MTGFQQSVALYPSPAVWGARASLNPTATVDAGPFNLTAGLLGAAVGKFGWQVLNATTGRAVVNSFSPLVPTLPDGFVGNEQQALITVWLAQNGLVIPPGYPVTLYNRGDWWAKAVYGPVTIGMKVYANLFSGDVYGGVTGLSRRGLETAAAAPLPQPVARPPRAGGLAVVRVLPPGRAVFMRFAVSP